MTHMMMMQPAAPRKRGGFLKAAGLGCLGLISFVFVLGIIGVFALGGDTGSTTTDQPAAGSSKGEQAKTETKADEPKRPGIGDPAKDGDFTFVVTKVRKGPNRIGDEWVNERAQGVFWLVYLKVTNHGDEPGMFSDSEQEVISKGKRYAADTEAGILLDDNEVWLEDINPGNTVTGTLVFDLPQGVTPEQIELHDSMFSGGVVVDLR